MGKQRQRRRMRQVATTPTEPAWTPFEVRQVVPADFDDYGARVNGRLYENNRYVVILSHLPNRGVYHLSLRRQDRAPIRDWRDLQRIKNELVGPEHLGLEMYPPESMLVDTSNQYHVWIYDEPGMKLPFGYRARLVAEGPYDDSPVAAGAVQRPFPADARPADLLTAEELTRIAGGRTRDAC